MADALAFYAAPAPMTAAGQHEALLAALPDDPAALARVVPGLLLHEFWPKVYGMAAEDLRGEESHIRPVARLLDRLLERDGGPLVDARPARLRAVGVCRHFAVLLTAMLRSKGAPARARCGFADYFRPGRFEDHWVCERWGVAEGRWMLTDAQLDDVQSAALKIDFDPLDVPRDRFLVAGDAWAACRSGAADPARFGISRGDLRGLWFVAGDLVRDLAALNGAEMLAWDVWGAMPLPDAAIPPADLALFDRIAALSSAPDAAFDELRALYAGDARLSVPPTVFNAVLNRVEPV